MSTETGSRYDRVAVQAAQRAKDERAAQSRVRPRDCYLRGCLKPIGVFEITCGPVHLAALLESLGIPETPDRATVEAGKRELAKRKPGKEARSE